MEGQRHTFGGEWTQQKLAILQKYLMAYITALKNQPFSLIYIDAFAGTGRISTKDEIKNGLFINFLKDKQEYLEGSARIALQVEPTFNKYIFIEKKHRYCIDLTRLKNEFPTRNIEIYPEEANICLEKLCYNIKWVKNRVVLFLDPYGMQVEWKTIKAIAKTKAIDLWYLFPLGVGVNRLLKTDGNIDQKHKDKLNRIFGEENWYEVFYKRSKEILLFEDCETVSKIATFDSIAKYIIMRLKTIFPGVAENPLLLYNSRNNPIYLFCFAAANPKGAKIALKIAEHILKG